MTGSLISWVIREGATWGGGIPAPNSVDRGTAVSARIVTCPTTFLSRPREVPLIEAFTCAPYNFKSLVRLPSRDEILITRGAMHILTEAR